MEELEKLTTDTIDYLEQEFSEFEKTYFYNERFWRAPVYTLINTPLFIMSRGEPD